MQPLSPLRKGRLTASQFGAALGLNPYMSRQALWREMTGRTPPFEGNEMTQWGADHEAEAINEYECATGNLVIPADFVPYGDWSGCSPDGYVGNEGMIEVKCPYSQRMYEEWPEYYRAQVVGQLAITQRYWCECWCWTPAGGKIMERITYNLRDSEYLIAALWEFWQHVVEDREPKRKKKYEFLNAALIATQI